MYSLSKLRLSPLFLLFARNNKNTSPFQIKVMLLLFWSVMLLANVEVRAQFTIPQIIVTPSSCQANGKVTVKGNVTYLNFLTGGNIPGQLGPLSGSELNVIFELLAPSSYTLTVIDPSNNAERQFPVTVTGNYEQNWIFSADVVYSPCSGGVPTINITNLKILDADVSEQRPDYFFRISGKNGSLPADGTVPPAYSTPLNGSFPIPLSGVGGNYEIQGKDACGNYKTINVTVPSSIPGPSVSDAFVKFNNCDGDANYKITASGGTAPYIFTIKSGPDQVGASQTNASEATFSLKALGTYVVEVKDQCGGTTEKTVKVREYTAPNAACWSSYGECDPAGGEGKGSIQVYVDLNSIGLGPAVVSLISTSGCSNPAPQTYPTNGNTVTFTGLIRPCTYTVVVTDACGKKFQKDVGLVGPGAGKLQCYKYYLCPNDGSTDYRVAIGIFGTTYNAKGPFIFEVIDSTTNANVAGYPVTKTDYTEIYPSLPKGKYYIKITDACGATCLDSVFVPKYSLPTVSVDVNNRCFGAGQANVVGVNNREKFWDWADYYSYWIDSGPSRVGQGPDSDSPPKVGQFSGLISGGAYKFAFSDGCKVVYAEVTIPTYQQPTWEVGFGAICPPRKVANIQVMNLQPAGKIVGPYTWRIISTDSPLYNTTAPYNGTLPYPTSLGQPDSTFVGLPPKDASGSVATYNIQGSDGCKNSYLGSGKIGTLPDETLILDKTVVCPDGKSTIKARVSVPVVGATYVYYRDNVKIAQSTTLFTDLTPALPGTYKVKVYPYFNSDTTCVKEAVAIVTGSGTLIVGKDSLTCAKRTIDLVALTAGSSAGTITYYKDRDLTQAVPTPSNVTEAGTYYFKLIPDGVANCAIVDSLVLLDKCRGSLGNYVWKDANDNGIQDANEKGVKGVIVQLLNASSTVIATDTTDADGLYTFAELVTGIYQVKIVISSLPDTCEITPKQNINDSQANPDERDSDFNPTTGLSQTVSIDATKTGIDKDNPTIDAGLILSCVKPVAGDSVAICQGVTTVNLKDAETKESWKSWSQNPAGVAIDPTTGVVTGLNAAGNYYFILTFNNKATCADTVKVTVTPRPVANATLKKQALCLGDLPTAYTATPSTGVSYAWYGALVDTTSSLGTAISGATTATFTPTGTAITTVGTRYYAVVVTNTQTSCKDTAFVCLVVNAKPNAGADSLGTNAICNTVGTIDLPNAAQGESWSQLGSTPKAVTINATTGVVTGMDVIGTYQFILKNATTGCADTVAVETKNCLKGSLGDFVWKDANDNGIQDLPSEKGVKGVIVQLLNGDTNAVLATDTTDASGIYGFTGLDSGKYKVKIVLGSLPDTCEISRKQDVNTGGGDDTNDSDFNPTTGESQVVVINTLGGGIQKDNPTIDAALYVPCVKPSAGADVAICEGSATSVDLKDASASEVWSKGAQPANTSASINSSTGLVTGLSAVGEYYFILTYKGQALCSDTVKVTVNAKPNAGADSLGANAICNTVGTIDLPNAAQGESWSQLGSTPKVVTIDATTGVVTGMDVIGTYQFILKNATTGCADTVAVETKNCLKGSIGDFVWKDANDNGIQDLPSEKGVKGVIVQLLNGDTNAVLATDTTDANGIYGFTGLDSGNYKVKIVLGSLPDTCEISSKQDVNTGGGNDTNDSDFNPTTGESQVVVINTLGSGIQKDNPTIDAALYVPCVKPSAGADVALCEGSSTSVYLKDASAGEVWSKGAQPANTSASINSSTGLVTGLSAVGEYYFILTYKGQALCSDTVKVTVNAKPNAGVDSLGVNAICNTVGTIDLPNAAQGESWSQLGSTPKVVTIDATTGVVTGMDAIGTYQFVLKNATTGCADTVSVETKNCLKGSLGDFVWKDANDNGIQDLPSEKGVKGVIVQLLNGDTNAVLATDTTDASGIYGFTSLDSGNYKVKIVLGSLPDTCQISEKQDVNTGGGDDTNDSDFNPTTGESQVVVINTLGSGIQKDNPTIDAALVVPCVKPTFKVVTEAVCSADAQTYSLSFSVTGKNGVIKVDQGTLSGNNPYTVLGVPSGAKLRIVDSLSAVCKFDTLITGPNCNCNPSLPTLLTPSFTVCKGDTFPTIKATVVGLATVEWFAKETGGTVLFSGLNFKPSGVVTGDTVFYAQARSTDPACPTAISTSRVPATIIAENCNIDLALKKLINKKIARIGDTLTYTIKLWNESKNGATGVEVADSIATTVGFVGGSFVASRGSAVIVGNVITWKIGAIAASGDTVTLSYKVKATQQGIHFNTAEISKTNEKDIDSTPNNGKDSEDDIDRQCFTVPYKLCPGEKVQANVSAKYTNVLWFKDGGSTPIASGNEVLLEGAGTYTITATNNICPAGGCCPVIIEPGDNCCPEDLCIPFSVNKKNLKKLIK